MAKKNTRKGSTRSTAKTTTVKTTVNDMTNKTDAAEKKETPVAKVEEKAAEVKENVAAKAAEVKEAIVTKAEEVKDATVKAKEEVKKATAAKTEEPAEAPKKRGRKPAAEKKETGGNAAKKPAAKKAEKFIPEVFLQYREYETEQSVIIERIKAQFVSEGHRAGNIKSLKVYIKPEDGAAYYVINDKTAGRVDLF